MISRAPTQSEFAGKEFLFLMEVQWQGRSWRFSSDGPLSLTSADGNSYEYDQPFGLSGLSQEVEYSGQVSTPSVQIGCIFPVNLATEWQQGRTLATGSATISMVLRDSVSGTISQTYESQFFLGTGQISQPQIAFPDQPTGATSFSVVLYMGASGGNSLLDNDWVIDGTTFASADIADNALDKAYPLVIGQPGVRYDNTGTEIKFEGSPAYMYDDTHTAPLLLITADLSYASQVTIIDNVGNSALLNISYKQDLQGNRYSYVDINGSAVETLQSTEWFCSWSHGGGIQNPYGSGALNGLGDVCRWALERSGEQVDHDAWAAAAPLLNRFAIDCYVNDPEIGAREWVEDVVLSLPFPLSLQEGPDGIRPITTEIDVPPSHAVASIEEGPEFQPASALGVFQEPSELVNDVVIRFAYDANRDRTRDRIRFTGNPNKTLSQTVITSEKSRESFDRYRGMAEEYETKILTDRGTAALVAQSRIALMALPTSRRSYTAPPSYGWLQAGDWIKFTSDSLSLTDEVCQIVSRAPLSDMVGWEFEIEFRKEANRNQPGPG
jgi:hypothetical protein